MYVGCSEKVKAIPGIQLMKYFALPVFLVLFAIRNILPYPILVDGVITVFLAVAASTYAFLDKSTRAKVNYYINQRIKCQK